MASKPSVPPSVGELDQSDLDLGDTSQVSMLPQEIVRNTEPDSATPLLKVSETSAVSLRPQALDTTDGLSSNMTSVLQKLSRQKTQPQPAIALQTVENRDQGNAVPSISLTRPSLTISPPTSLLSDKNANTEKMRKSETESSAGIQFSDVVTSAFTTQSSLASSNSSTEICIYMMDNSGLTFNLDDGRTATADAILDLVLDELDIPSLYKPCFGIWISSSLLHLQLRPYHIPHRMAKHWGDLLVKFTLANLDQLEKDEPILRLQRNVFLSPSAELSIDHSEVLRLLYCEARENVLESLYPLDISDSYKLAGMASCHEYGSFSANDHDIGFYSDKIDPLLPEWIEKSNSAILGCSGSSFFARLFSRTEKVRGQLCLDLQRAHQEETNKFTVCSNNYDDKKILPRWIQNSLKAYVHTAFQTLDVTIVMKGFAISRFRVLKLRP